MENKYEKMILRQQREFDEFPIKFAITDEQFQKGMEELGLTVEDTDKIYRTSGGGFYRKEDSTRLNEMLDHHTQEYMDEVNKDTTGDGFIYQMFLYELNNHEYDITLNATDTLDELGYTLEELKQDERFYHGFLKAKFKIEQDIINQ